MWNDAELSRARAWCGIKRRTGANTNAFIADFGLILAKRCRRRVGTEVRVADAGSGGYTTVHSVVASDGRSRLVRLGKRRVRMTFMAPPHFVHVSVGRGLKYAVALARFTLSSTCSNWIRRLALGCAKPKLRTRRKYRGSTWRNTSRRK